MPRPSRPLLSRKSIVATSLELIDRDGLATFSMPGLASAMSVRAASLYHHFRDKAEILSEVARYMVSQTAIPARPSRDEWQEWFVSLAANLRDVLLEHPHAAPLMLQFPPRDILVAVTENSAAVLVEYTDFPSYVHILILDTLEKVTLGAALSEVMKAPEKRDLIYPHVDHVEHPILTRGLASNPWTVDEIFRESVRALLAGVATRFEQPRVGSP
ncbi:Tetracyclin repressor, C-terminal all-alpha domain [Parafrankia irregularis]|uniref:Tetracyclin repressor, C-terminal all-alpha domain n=1 Tax=Parafrankia irregularis TaxID=795642 RepID=A0A0S4QMH6_9ACTN|nr:MULTISPECIES: TetR/AcrR family transcriptional regulator [Parafrankia]MBE3200045.1 TetR/AcrR family transcriptional regulator [Parafrankia sp. CH37]CUU56768.1 Tetracyclin repressor, C-terminal all-alpha domain [Parafrankia irregularis]